MQRSISKDMKLQLFGLSLLVFMLSGCLYLFRPAASNADNAVNSNSPTSANVSAASVESLSETFAKYERITEEMTIAQVEAILGKADEMRQIQIAGEPEIQLYTWRNANGSTIKVQFRNNSLITKSQLGLVSAQPLVF